MLPGAMPGHEACCDVHVLVDYASFEREKDSLFQEVCSVSLHICAALGVQERADPALSSWQGRVVDGCYDMGTRDHWNKLGTNSRLGTCLLVWEHDLHVLVTAPLSRHLARWPGLSQSAAVLLKPNLFALAVRKPH